MKAGIEDIIQLIIIGAVVIGPLLFKGIKKLVEILQSETYSETKAAVPRTKSVGRTAPRQQRRTPSTSPPKNIEQIMSELFGGEPAEEAATPLSTYKEYLTETKPTIPQESTQPISVHKPSKYYENATMKERDTPVSAETSATHAHKKTRMPHPDTKKKQSNAIRKDDIQASSEKHNIHADAWQKSTFSWDTDNRLLTHSVQKIRSMRRADWQHAIILKEILAPPVSMRKEHPGH
jgi:hypothetical protein